MSWFRDLPLRRKMFWLIIAASGATLLAAGATVLLYEATAFRPEAQHGLSSLAGLLKPSLLVALRFQDSDEAVEDLDNMMRDSRVHAACLYDSASVLFAESMKSDFAFSCPPEPPAAGFRSTNGLLGLCNKLIDEGGQVGSLLLVRTLPPLYARLPQYGFMLGLVVFALVSVSLFLSLALERLVSGPVRRLAMAARQVRDGEDFSVRVRKSGNDEVGELTEAFNDMLVGIEQRDAELKKAQSRQEELHDQLLQARKMESIGRLAGGVAHDFNNYLTVIVGSTDLTLSQLPPESPVTRLLENVRKATGQATNLTQQLLAFARQQIIEPRIIDPSRLLLDMEKMLRSLVGDNNELAVIPHGKPWMLRADPNQMTQVLMNLVVNARDAMPGGGTVTIEIHNVNLDEEAVRDEPELKSGEYVLFRVVDTGVGMNHASLKRLFEPFFTTKEHGKGTGLGLATTYGIVKQSGGHIVVESKPGYGSVFKIFMPRCEGETVDRSSIVLNRKLPSGRETILVVEDNALVRQTAVSLLAAQGYTVLEAAGGPDAIHLVERYEGKIDLLMTDVVMPEMSGRDVADHLHITLPSLKVLYVSGYTDVIAEEGELEMGIEFLQKPYTSEALMYRVRAILDERKPTDV